MAEAEERRRTEDAVKTIGVLGGIGPQATMQFEERLHREAQALALGRANESYPPLVVWYHRGPPMVADDQGEPIEPIRPAAELLDGARWLGQVADFVVITSNGAHVLAPWVEEAAGRPVLSMVELVAEEAVRRGWRRVGVPALFAPHVYEAALAPRAVAVETIGGQLQADLDAAIFSVMAGSDGAASRTAGDAAVAELRGRGVDGLILGCTEIPFLVPGEVAAPDVLDPIGLLARAALRRAID